jgi:hypothetical protein
MARCPAHEDKRPSLAICDRGDGRVLIDCFGGCSTEDILGAVGLAWRDIMPPRPLGDRISPTRSPFDAWTEIRCCADDLVLAAIMISDLA